MKSALDMETIHVCMYSNMYAECRVGGMKLLVSGSDLTYIHLHPFTTH